MTRIEAIAFDLDGTLVDTAGGIAHALNVALQDAGLAPFDLATVRAWIGDGPDALIVRALTAAAPDLADAPAVATRLRRSFDAATLRAPMQGSAVFDGIADAVHTLAARLPLVVVTNKPTALARAVLNEARLLTKFAGVYGADTPIQRKPSPLLIRQAADTLRISTRHLLMVGDAAGDLAAAEAAGSPAAWAGWGYGDAPAESVPAWRLSAPHDLLVALAMPAAADTEH